MSQLLSRMGHFTAWSMRDPVPYGGIAIDTCARNDTSDPGTDLEWSFCNPTNRALRHEYRGLTAVSVEALWQGLKVRDPADSGPDPRALAGDWRRGKRQRPAGHWNGRGEPLLSTSGAARRAIYIPAYGRLIDHWLANEPAVKQRLARAQRSPKDFYLRDYDTGRGIDRNGPMSHAWALCVWLNTGAWPERDATVLSAQRGLFDGA